MNFDNNLNLTLGTNYLSGKNPYEGLKRSSVLRKDADQNSWFLAIMF